MRIRLTSLSSAAQKIRAVAHPTRLAILHVLRGEPSTPATLLRRLRISAPLLSHHLRILYESGWVTKTKFGALVTYYADEKTEQEVIKLFKKIS